MPKDALIKARVSKEVKDAVTRIAEERGESEAVIVREALNALIVREDAAATAPTAPPKSVSYLKSSSKRRRKVA